MKNLIKKFIAWINEPCCQVNSLSEHVACSPYYRNSSDWDLSESLRNTSIDEVTVNELEEIADSDKCEEYFEEQF